MSDNTGERPNRCRETTWVTRGDAVAVTVLALVFLIWVGWIAVRQRTVGDDIRVISQDGNAGGYLVDLNRAGVPLLELLPGIGKVRAERVVEWRREKGRFRTLDEVRKAPGLSKRQVDALAELVTLGDSAPARAGDTGRPGE